jgi:hypothetical protein
MKKKENVIRNCSKKKIKIKNILSLTSFENYWAIFEDEARIIYRISKRRLPKKVKVGDIFLLKENGELKFSAKKTKKAKREIKFLEDKLFSN